jgi:adenine-specific DNA glycosylase
VEHTGGQLPQTADALLKVPGIGPYTAASVSSIAFGQQRAAVDGNVIRVLSRIYAHLQVEPAKAAVNRQAAINANGFTKKIRIASESEGAQNVVSPSAVSTHTNGSLGAK